ncbi:MAG: hypothetical protein ILO68_04995 [Clostridia bacterium]|nr:hypothetical protein [Clostridia bacterium]
MQNLFRPLPLLNSIGKVDLTFLLIVIGAIVLAVAFYFLIPLFRRKQYKEARENLKKREEAFRAATGSSSLSANAASAPAPEEDDASGPAPAAPSGTEDASGGMFDEAQEG